MRTYLPICFIVSLSQTKDKLRTLVEFSIRVEKIISSNGHATFFCNENVWFEFSQKVNVLSDDQWPAVLAEYVRHNDEALLKASEKILAAYRDELLPCASFDEFCDVAG